MKAEFCTLTNAGRFVDMNLLNKGIYVSVKPVVLEKGTTIEHLVKQAEMAKDLTGSLMVSAKYIPNLRQCTISRIDIILHPTPKGE